MKRLRRKTDPVQLGPCAGLSRRPRNTLRVGRVDRHILWRWGCGRWRRRWWCGGEVLPLMTPGACLSAHPSYRGFVLPQWSGTKAPRRSRKTASIPASTGPAISSRLAAKPMQTIYDSAKTRLFAAIEQVEGAWHDDSTRKTWPNLVGSIFLLRKTRPTTKLSKASSGTKRALKKPTRHQVG